MKNDYRRGIEWIDILLVALLITSIIFAIGIAKAQEADAAEWQNYCSEHLAIIEEMHYTQPENPSFELSPEEFEMVAAVVASEARGQCLSGQMAVAQTIRDRAVQREQTVEEVLTAPNQYAAPYDGEIDTITYDAVENIFMAGWYIFEYPTTHFFNPSKADPDWADKLEVRGKIQNHIFYE